jgi:hypothetical protein
MTPKKAVDVLSRPKNEPVLSELCSTRFPIKETYIKGDSVVKYDTLWGLVTDTIVPDPQVLVYRDTVKVPKLVTKTVTTRDTVVKENTAKVSFLNSQIEKLKEVNLKQSEMIGSLTTERDEYKSKFNKARLINWFLYVVIGLSIGIWIRKKFKLF